MADLLTSLIPLALGSAILPLQIAITVLMLQAPGGRRTAIAWVGGMTLVRLAQWLVIGLVIGAASAEEAGEGTGPIQATLLLLIGILFLVSAARKLVDQPDEDAPPPRWMGMIAGIGAGRAFALGAGMVGLAPKLWAFTLGAIAAIADAELGAAGSWAAFIGFVIAAQSIHLAVIAVAVLAPERADALLVRISSALERHNRTLMIGLGLVFGTWLLVTSLTAFGIL